MNNTNITIGDHVKGRTRKGLKVGAGALPRDEQYFLYEAPYPLTLLLVLDALVLGLLIYQRDKK